MARIEGTDGPDRLRGTRSDDEITGFAGDDRLFGLDGDDLLTGESGRDILSGASGSDTLRGGDGDDKLRGGTSVQEDGGSIDRLFGDDGNDRLFGGIDGDLLAGGNGRDRFIFGDIADSRPNRVDEILDFTDGVDKLVFRESLANAGVTLRFVGKQEFSGNPGEIRYFVADDNQSSIVLLDSDGDASADMAVALTGAHALETSDFRF